MEQDNKIKKVIEEFEKTFEEYYEYFLEFYNSRHKKNSIYHLAHIKLVDSSIKLQAVFLKLPQILQERLYSLEFEVFLQCDNIVDFYAFRNFLTKSGRYYQFATIAERVDSELKLTKELLDKDIWDSYSKLPKRNFSFYRNCNKSLLKELDSECKEKSTKNDDKESFVEKYTDFINREGNAIKETEEIASKIFKAVSYAWKFLA